MAGFADGFRSGFGLISDVKDRELKRDQVEAEATYKKQQADDLAAYRNEDLRIKDAAQKSAAGLDALRLSTAQTQAETASITAKTAFNKAEDAKDPTSLAFQKTQAEIDEIEARAAKSSADADASAQKVDMTAGANNVQRIYDLVQADDKTPETYREIANLIESNKAQTFFNLGYITSPQTQRSLSTIQNFYQDMASGNGGSMSPDVRSAVGAALGLNKSAALGRKIDDSFVNAPDWMKGKNLRISGQGLHEVSSTDGKTLTGRMYVLAKDDDGKVSPYFPPLTANRNFQDGESLRLDIDPVTQSLAGVAHMVNGMAPEIQKEVKDAKIYAEYGSKKDFNAAVDSELRAISVSLSSGGNLPQELVATYPQLAEMTPMKRSEFAESREYRRQIEHEMLFGATDDRTEQFKIEEWFDATSAALASAPVPKGVNAENLGDLMNRNKASFNYENASILNGYYTEEGEIEDADGLVEQLKKLNLLQ
jgi:hypothetical protein